MRILQRIHADPAPEEALMSDYPPIHTVLDRLLAAGIARHHAERHIRYGRVRVDGVPTTDPHTPASPPARVVLYRAAQDTVEVAA